MVGVDLSLGYRVEWENTTKVFTLFTWNDEITFEHDEVVKLVEFLDSVRYEIIPYVPEPGTVKCSNCDKDVHVGRATGDKGYRYWYNCKVCDHGENLTDVSQEVKDYIEKMNKELDDFFGDRVFLKKKERI